MTDERQCLLEPIDDTLPTGPNLEYDRQFQTLEELARPRPERALGAGVIASEPPQWRQVAEHAQTLLQRSKDLRVAVHRCTAQLHLQGFIGWADGLALVQGLLERFWNQLHPHLDDGDPTERINALAALSDGAALTALRSTRVLLDAHPAHFSLRELRLAQGLQRAPDGTDGQYPGLGAIHACLRDSPLTALTTLEAALHNGEQSLKAIGALFAKHTPGRGPELDPLLRDVGELHAFVLAFVHERNPATAIPATAQGHAPGATDNASGTAVQGQQDVRRVLEQVCQYYAQCEPSSPVPLLLRRAQRLVGLDFPALLRDLAPGGIAELEQVSGDTPED